MFIKKRMKQNDLIVCFGDYLINVIQGFKFCDDSFLISMLYMITGSGINFEIINCLK